MEIPVTEARAQFADLVNRVAYTGDPVLLTRRGRPMAALVSAEDLELLRAVHELQREQHIDLTRTTAPGAPDERPAARPLRIAAELRPAAGPKPGRPPGFGR
ncbi:type II toxin-antitoxin system Phd/YefM family antitoxin [Actinomadura atramentaria]|uniref:type II toxin-antitoxin system Phd/YefM family antitoxin n=1 Tax=Actinomadura atramentaria TaxID=1990 RepID=UPI000370AC77|nr:type II toxin-antitoxin system Phd/YefM family antitoxin [Actinomadura atramentaria]